MEYLRYQMTMEGSVSTKLFDEMTEAQRKFDKAVDQISVLDLQLRDLETRYKRAVKNKKNSFRYNLRLKLSVVTGIKMMYNHFASKKAEEIRHFSRQLELIWGNEMQNFDPRDPNSRPDVAQEPENDIEAENEPDSFPTNSSPSSSGSSHDDDDSGSSGDT